MRENASAENAHIPRKLPLVAGPVFPRFSAQEVTDDCLARAIAMACKAGTEWNLQPCRWIVARSEAAKKRLESAICLEVPVGTAPVILICLSDTLAWKSAPQRLQEMVVGRRITEEQGRDVLRRVQEYYSSSPETARRTALANGMMAVQQMLQGVAACGLSAYLLTEYDEAKIQTHFHIPDNFAVVGLISIGYSEEKTPPPASPGAPHALIYQEKFGKLLGS